MNIFPNPVPLYIFYLDCISATCASRELLMECKKKKSSNSALEIDISKEKSALPNKLNPKYKDSEKKKSQASLTPTGIYKINNMVCSVLGRKPTSFKIIKCYHQERSSQVPNKVVWDTKALPILQCHTNVKNLKTVALTVFVIF